MAKFTRKGCASFIINICIAILMFTCHHDVVAAFSSSYSSSISNTKLNTCSNSRALYMRGSSVNVGQNAWRKFPFRNARNCSNSMKGTCSLFPTKEQKRSDAQYSTSLNEKQSRYGQVVAT